MTTAETAIAADQAPLLALSDITKAYPGCLANDQVNLNVRRGEVHGLIGENGAGKSTLVKILYGVLAADSGRYRFDGRDVTVSSPVDARRLGIAMVFQHFSLFPAMTALENIALGLPGTRAGDTLATRINGLAQEYNLKVELTQPVHQLSVGERQRIEILRCLALNPRLLVMDEPTSVLTPSEIDDLMSTLTRIREEGRAVLFISHKLDEVRRICQSVTVLRHGRVVGATPVADTTDADLVRMMTGEVVHAPSRPAARQSPAPLMSVTELNLPGNEHSPGLSDIHFQAYGGEILGIAGVAGNGQSELLALLGGEVVNSRQPSSIALEGTPCAHLDAGKRRTLGLAYVPEDRLGQGSVPDMTLVDNTLLTARFTRSMTALGVIQHRECKAFTEQIVEEYDVRCSGIRAPASSLSGGNLQKFILGREVLQQPRVLLVAHPTWGVDAGATAAIRQRLLAIADAGAAVIVVSHDLDELLQIAHRVAVMHRGSLSEPQAIDAVSTQALGLLMTGASASQG